jgi:hypothetical protein
LKRKASTSATQKLSRLRKDTKDSDNNAGDTEIEDGGDVDYNAVEPTEIADSGEEDGSTEANYMSTKALGDADRGVSYLLNSTSVDDIQVLHIAQPSPIQNRKNC